MGVRFAGGLLVVALAVLMYALTETPRIEHTSALNATFDARWMIAGTRLLAVVAAGYLLASIVVRVQQGQWARSAGTFVADPNPTQNVVDDQEDLQEQLRNANTVIANLEDQLGQARATIESLSATVDDPRATGHTGSPGERVEDADGTNT